MQATASISSPVPVVWYPTLAVAMVAVGLMLTASFFMSGLYANSVEIGKPICLRYEATSSRHSRSFAKEITTAAVASVFLGFGSLFVLLASGVYV
ncbi:hypothetical protein PR202_ga06939 [Eleusine coracana subsp. coracana]|uniref:Dolichyl-diphosphooligosaccharide-protein glycosyltransferase subunit OST5 n=1 Tax=Eleusine coracana subsp. coracana TaxID=191504 RepID=A0AAV5BYM6_ELECO|nr:hypothetical protein PR202_ga06939 [Eleusine coracana subsp. coracana]